MSRIASFFSDCGGLDKGFQMSDFDIVWSHKNTQACIQTYQANFSQTKISTKDFLSLDARDLPPNISGFICGPEYLSLRKFRSQGLCPQFNHLIRLIQSYQPKFVYLDSANSLMDAAKREILQRIMQQLQDAGYVVHVQRLNALDYDVPQQRKQVAIIAFRQDLQLKYWFPKKRPALTVKQALESLSSTAQVISQDSEIGAHPHHIYLKEDPDLLAYQPATAPWEQPLPALQPLYRKIPLHPGSTQPARRLTVRECAKLQTFPDSFQFCFNDIKAAYQHVIQNTPVHLAKHLALSIKRCLESSHWY